MEEPDDGAVEIFCGASIRNCGCDAGACGVGAVRDGGGDCDWSAHGDADRATADAAKSGSWNRGDFSDHSEPGAVRVPDSYSFYWGNWEAHGHRGADGLRAAADPAKYLCGLDGN